MTINRRLLMLGGAGALGGCTMQRGVPRIGTMDAAPAAETKKTYSDSEVIACSLENPEACEACQ